MLTARKELNSIPDYIPGKSIDEIKEKYKLKQVIKLASNENPLGASPLAKVAYRKCVERMCLYPRGSAPELIHKLAIKWKIRAENLIVGNGSDEILDLAARAYLNKNDYASGASSTFSVYSSVTKAAGAKYKAFPLENFCYPLETLLSFEKAKVIFVCNPNNPTGTYYKNEVIFNFLKRISGDALVVLDMAYMEFTGEKEPPLHKWIEQFPNLLCTRTFSKLYGLAGLRVGYGIASEKVIKTLKKIKLPFNSNYPAQMAATAALKDAAFAERALKLNESGRTWLTQNLQKAGLDVLPSKANFICVKFGKRAPQIVEWLESKGMVIRFLGSFGMPEYVRITVGTALENKKLVSLIF
jgi:histidinol-phosphate aminotransferase